MNFEDAIGPYIRDNEEGLFSRDADGRLIRKDDPNESDYTRQVTVQIDGESVTVPLAHPLEDADGNVVVDLQGRTKPVFTTILDAARQLYSEPGRNLAELPIPTLCHQPHMAPVGVCRLCVVQIYSAGKGGNIRAERKLLPACQYPVAELENGVMQVFTKNATGEHAEEGKKVANAVKVVSELLAADHLKDVPAEAPPQLNAYNELRLMAASCGADETRFRDGIFTEPPPPARERAGRRAEDFSSPVFLVDHSACILCDRCVRACTDVKHNQIIGRTGKGATAGIGFDLNDAMAESGCVQCGECMISCPTSAITFKPLGKVTVADGVEDVPATDIVKNPIFAPLVKFFHWQEGLVNRYRVGPGHVFCRQGDPGNFAIMILSGKLKITVHETDDHRKVRRDGKVRRELVLGPDSFICGEMACLSGLPRTADVTVEEAGEFWTVRRNVVDRLMRIPSLQVLIQERFRRSALQEVMDNAELFKKLDDKDLQRVVKWLGPKLTFVRLAAGQDLFRQDDPADDMYFIQLGHVRVNVARYGSVARVITRAPGAILGEIGLLALSRKDLEAGVDATDARLGEQLANANGKLVDVIEKGARTATCTALEPLNLARVTRADFLELVKEFPKLRRLLVEQSLDRLERDLHPNPFRREYVEQGLFEARSVLALDLDNCTRCDECTRGCIEQHGTHSHGVGVSRLFRDGPRFGNFVVATSCRSCETPHCMTGCPVDSIHRGKHLQIVIEDHCIGCRLCEKNCPYGSIYMVKNVNPDAGARFGQLKAANCDLCDAEGERETPEPRCVSACPHHAAHRYVGAELLKHALADAPTGEKQRGVWSFLRKS